VALPIVALALVVPLWRGVRQRFNRVTP